MRGSRAEGRGNLKRAFWRLPAVYAIGCLGLVLSTTQKTRRLPILTLLDVPSPEYLLKPTCIGIIGAGVVSDYHHEPGILLGRTGDDVKATDE